MCPFWSKLRGQSWTLWGVDFTNKLSGEFSLLFYSSSQLADVFSRWFPHNGVWSRGGCYDCTALHDSGRISMLSPSCWPKNNHSFHRGRGGAVQSAALNSAQFAVQRSAPNIVTNLPPPLRPAAGFMKTQESGPPSNIIFHLQIFFINIYCLLPGCCLLWWNYSTKSGHPTIPIIVLLLSCPA